MATWLLPPPVHFHVLAAHLCCHVLATQLCEEDHAVCPLPQLN